MKNEGKRWLHALPNRIRLNEIAAVASGIPNCLQKDGTVALQFY